MTSNEAQRKTDFARAIYKGRIPDQGIFKRGDDYTQGYADAWAEIAEQLAMEEAAWAAGPALVKP